MAQPNTTPQEQRDVQDLLFGAFRAGLTVVDPARTLPAHLPPPGGRLVVFGAGKAAAAMARTTERFYRAHYPDAALEGMVVTRYGHNVPTERIRVIEASHPVPDAAGVAATDEILGLAEGLGEGASQFWRNASSRVA